MIFYRKNAVRNLNLCFASFIISKLAVLNDENPVNLILKNIYRTVSGNYGTAVNVIDIVYYRIIIGNSFFDTKRSAAVRTQPSVMLRIDLDICAALGAFSRNQRHNYSLLNFIPPGRRE